jgi:cysteinyl-tRNA synthetase
MKLYNTMTMSKEEFAPMEPGKVGIYACGPTVYNFIHVGNARPIIVFDALRRYLEYRGFDVTFVQNFTDVDDKIINRANEEGATSEAIAEKYIAEYLTDARGLGVRDATIQPKATEHIAEIVEMISTLIGKGLAYQTGGGVYFKAAQFEGYGKLSGQRFDELVAGARVDVSEDKENPADFALWKTAKPGEPYWDSPWGRGRPGWHIECSAMSRKYLGETIDIHCGGQDLVFPHHENEIAQSEGCSGRQFVRYWLHNGYISIDSKKMSKSAGNFFTVREAANAYGYETIRMFVLMSHYRSPLNYSEEVLGHAKNALARLKTTKENLEYICEHGADAGALGGSVSGADAGALGGSVTGANAGALGVAEMEFIETFPRWRERFVEAMDDDFNTADAIAVLFEFARACNAVVATGTGAGASKPFASAALAFYRELADVLNLFYGDAGDGAADVGEEVEELIKARQAARSEKNWAEADRIRDELNRMGIILEDTPQGVKWKKA